MSSSSQQDFKFKDNRNAGRYELLTGGNVVGSIEYTVANHAMTFTRTSVQDEYAGRGVAGTLVGKAMDDVRARGLAVVPECTYVQSWLRKHPDCRSLVADEDCVRFDLARED